MAKITIVIEDTEDGPGGVYVKFDSEPPIDKNAKEITMSQTLAAKIAKTLGLAKEGEDGNN